MIPFAPGAGPRRSPPAPAALRARPHRPRRRRRSPSTSRHPAQRRHATTHTTDPQVGDPCDHDHGAYADDAGAPPHGHCHTEAAPTRPSHPDATIATATRVVSRSWGPPSPLRAPVAAPAWSLGARPPGLPCGRAPLRARRHAPTRPLGGSWPPSPLRPRCDAPAWSLGRPRTSSPLRAGRHAPARPLGGSWPSSPLRARRHADAWPLGRPRPPSPFRARPHGADAPSPRGCDDLDRAVNRRRQRHLSVGGGGGGAHPRPMGPALPLPAVARWPCRARLATASRAVGRMWRNWQTHRI